MNGQPVWLASISKVDPISGRVRVTGRWTPEELLRRTERLRWVLRGVGDPTLERLFRMNLTLCLHRAATAEEIAGLPASWHGDESGMAGGPVEHLWAKGFTAPPSSMPCERPDPSRRLVVDPAWADELWAPLDCHECGPCLARASLNYAAAAARTA